MKTLIDEIKEMVAERHNYADNVLGNRWDFAMMITHRKKKQLQLYEEVILELSKQQVCDRVNNYANNRCINCGAKAGHKCEI